MKRYVVHLLMGCLLIGLTGGCGDIKRSLYEGFQRDRWQQPERVIHALGIEPGEHIADIGAGGGYFTFRLADASSPAGKVYAADIDEDMIQLLEARTEEEGYLNITMIRSKYDDPLLSEQGVDLVFMCNTFHHLEDRVAYFETLKQYLHSRGRVAIIDFEGKTWFQRLFGHITPAVEVRKDMEAAGYRLVQDFDFLPKQNYQIFMIQE